ncbi:hypothetical protein [Rhizobium sp. AN80A]|uniref:EF-hand domain-containing protein n=1 Tax=Rhizobium sp. AN80A TaxID=3040673 RepID=UPI0024B33F32|nr:hypothetical protein [Rhizobium sp. AN80A]
MTRRYQPSLRKASAIVSLVGTALGGLADAAAQTTTPPTMPPSVLIESIRASREAYLAQVFSAFRTYSGPDQILTAEDIEKARNIGAAAARAGVMKEFFAADLNDDGRVTLEEMAAVNRNRPGVSPFDVVGALDDGVVTLEEANAAARIGPAQARDYGVGAILIGLLALDLDKDGKLTADELEKQARAAFAYYDRDGDGALSATETRALATARTDSFRERAAEELLASCSLPRAGAADTILNVRSYEAGALSDVTVAGQDGVTETSELNIEAGDTPLYIVASSYTAMIWRVTGHVGRVSRIVVSSPAGAGAVGLPKEKVTSIRSQGCLRYQSAAVASGSQQLAALGKVLGKPVDAIIDAYTLPKAVLPSDGVAPRDLKPGRNAALRSTVAFSAGGLENVDADTYRSFMRFSPSGLIRIDPADVVSDGKAQRYEVLPQEAGLLQLLMSGSLRTQQPGLYTIDKPIARFPAGLNGAHQVRFVLPEGVPRPAGNPGHSTLIRPNGSVFTPEELRLPEVIRD